MRRVLTKFTLLMLLTTACASGDVTRLVPVDPATQVRVGRGAYLTGLPAGEKPPSNFAGVPVTPKVVEGFAGPPNTNDWWSSLIWQFDFQGRPNPHSMPMFPHPLAVKAQADGLAVGYPDKPVVGKREYFFPFAADLLLSVAGLHAPATRVARYSDWTVTARWQNQDGARRLDATFGHGLPFVYAELAGGAARIVPTGAFEVWFNQGPILGITVAGHHYGVFGPKGTKWQIEAREGGHIASDLAGHDFYSVAVLPDRGQLDLFARHAYAFVTNTRVGWQYDSARGALQTTYSWSTEIKQPAGVKDAATVPLVAVYPHQWRAATAAWQPGQYRSPRGPMKLCAADTLVTAHNFHGVVPLPPDPRKAAGFSQSRLADYLAAVANADELFPVGPEQTRGTYWVGKSLQKVANLVWIADQLGDHKTRDKLLTALEAAMEDWFDGQPPGALAYDQNWRTLIGVPAEYRMGWELNDHHFHYAYFIFAAATVANFDPAWAAESAYGAMIDLLIKDCANADRKDQRFPFLRYFDPYAGHSWANGPSLFAEGNNEESSSEDANFAASLVLWGAVTARDDIRDLGIYLYTQLGAAIENYWFDVHGDVFPDEFTKPVVAIVWGSGGKYDTWWDRNPVYVHGINMLPFTGGSLYLGQRPDFVRKNYDAVVKANHGEVLLWRDIVWMYLALADADAAMKLFERDAYFEPEFGNSHAALYHWLGAFQRVGQVDTRVTADGATAVVFQKAGQRTYAAWNPSAAPATFEFSDGTRLSVAPRRIADLSRSVTP